MLQFFHNHSTLAHRTHGTDWHVQLPTVSDHLVGPDKDIHCTTTVEGDHPLSSFIYTLFLLLWETDWDRLQCTGTVRNVWALRGIFFNFLLPMNRTQLGTWKTNLNGFAKKFISAEISQNEGLRTGEWEVVWTLNSLCVCIISDFWTLHILSLK